MSFKNFLPVKWIVPCGPNKHVSKMATKHTAEMMIAKTQQIISWFF